MHCKPSSTCICLGVARITPSGRRTAPTTRSTLSEATAKRGTRHLPKVRPDSGAQQNFSSEAGPHSLTLCVIQYSQASGRLAHRRVPGALTSGRSEDSHAVRTGRRPAGLMWWTRTSHTREPITRTSHSCVPPLLMGSPVACWRPRQQVYLTRVRWHLAHAPRRAASSAWRRARKRAVTRVSFH